MGLFYFEDVITHFLVGIITPSHTAARGAKNVRVFAAQNLLYFEDAITPFLIDITSPSPPAARRGPEKCTRLRYWSEGGEGAAPMRKSSPAFRFFRGVALRGRRESRALLPMGTSHLIAPIVSIDGNFRARCSPPEKPKYAGR